MPDKERESAPLVDTELSQLRPRFVKRISEATDERDAIEAVVLDTPNLELHLRDARSVAERVANKGIGSLIEIIALRAVSAEVTLSGLCCRHCCINSGRTESGSLRRGD